MNRGADHQDIFECAGDGRHFLDLVGEGCRRADASVAAYCLMTNHYHLLVNCPSADLAALMHHIGWNYSRYVNRRHDRDGPVFRGRFRSRGVDGDEYLATAGRYIHRNPLDVRPPVALDRYRWSSYRHYVGAVAPPSWLTTTELLAGQQVHQYRQFVEGDAAA